MTRQRVERVYERYAVSLAVDAFLYSSVWAVGAKEPVKGCAFVTFLQT
jgi:hypothetical protein